MAVLIRRNRSAATLSVTRITAPSNFFEGHSGGKDFVCGDLFVTLLACGAKKPLNSTAKWFLYCTSDCEYFYDLTGTDGQDHSKWYYKKKNYSKVFFEKWNGNQKPKKKSQKTELGKNKWYNQMGQVGTSVWDKWDQGSGSSDL